MAWDDRLKDVKNRRERARGMGGQVGTFNVSDVPGQEEATPADSKVAGFGTIDGRPAAACSNDFTVLAATSSRVASHKEAELKPLAVRRDVPIVYLAEAGGARMPDIMGAAGIASIARFLELSRTKRAVGRHRLAGWPTKF
ncbi:MAG: hypothetical protein HYS77_10475 [Candidatus Rokubacteria bacterium]|nr:hypothetical protein [Candidatus Rokubacteria bacterium]